MGRPKGYHLNRAAFEFVLRERGMKKTEVADAAGKNLSFVSDLCFGRYGASAETVKAITNALRCEAEVIFPEFAGYLAPTRSAA